jgi:hypothetical protein
MRKLATTLIDIFEFGPAAIDFGYAFGLVLGIDDYEDIASFSGAS